MKLGLLVFLLMSVAVIRPMAQSNFGIRECVLRTWGPLDIKAKDLDRLIERAQGECSVLLVIRNGDREIVVEVYPDGTRMVLEKSVIRKDPELCEN